MAQVTSFKAAIAEIKIAHTISDYIRASGVRLTASGPGRWKGLCPFHNEKSPSFTCSDQFQNYHCFGCGASGDIISYVMATESLEFGQAVRKLAEAKGIEIETSKSDGVDYKAIRAALRDTANFFYKNYKALSPDHPARLQVTERGLSESGMIYGYAPEKRTALYEHLKDKYSEEVLLGAGVISKWENTGKISDFWSGRLMFIITDSAGAPIGFSGRKLFEGDKRGKFVNSQAGPVFDKSSAMFNIQNAKKAANETQEVYVAEGQFDVAAFIEADAPNVVASSGTAFTPKQGQILQRLVGDKGKVIFAFDGDKAGQKAALTVFNNVPSLHSSAYVVPFPEGKDPCDYRLEKGNDPFLHFVEAERLTLIEFVLKTYENEVDLTTDIGRSKYLDHAARVLKTITSRPTREAHIAQVALTAFADSDEVRVMVANAEPLDLHARTEAVADTQTEEDRSYEEAADASDEILERMDKIPVYNLTARFIALSLQFPELLAYLPKNKPKLPEHFWRFIDEVTSLEQTARLVPELFTDTKLAQQLITGNYFPFAHLPQFKPRDQFAYLYKQIVTIEKTSAERAVRTKVARMIASSPDSSAAYLEQAIAREEQELERLAAS